VWVGFVDGVVFFAGGVRYDVLDGGGRRGGYGPFTEQ